MNKMKLTDEESDFIQDALLFVRMKWIGFLKYSKREPCDEYLFQAVQERLAGNENWANRMLRTWEGYRREPNE